MEANSTHAHGPPQPHRRFTLLEESGPLQDASRVVAGGAGAATLGALVGDEAGIVIGGLLGMAFSGSICIRLRRQRH